MSQVRYLLGRSGVSLFVRVAGLGLTFVATVFMSRLLGIEQFGAYSIALSYASIAAVAVRLGFDSSAVRFVAVYREQANGRLIRRFLWSAAAAITGVWSLLIGAGLVAGWAGLLPLHRFPAGLLANAALVAFALALIGLFSAVLRSFDRIFESQFYEQMLRPLLIVAGLLAALVTGWSIDASLAMGITAFSLVVAVLIAAARSWQKVRLLPAGSGQLGEGSLWIKVGSVLAVMSVAIEMLNQIEVILLGLLTTNAQSALFVAAQRLSTLATLGLGAIVLVSGPRIAAAFHTGDRDTLAALAKASARLSFFSALVLGAGLAVISPFVLPLWGPEFSAALPILLILLVGAIMNAATGAAGYLTVLTGHERAAFCILLLTLMITIAVELFLIPRFGATGAAVGSAIGVTTWNLLMAAYVRRTLGIDCTVMGRPPILPRSGTRNTANADTV